MSVHSKLVRMKIANLGCVGPEGLEISLDRILCLVGPNNAGKSTVLRAYELAVAGGPLKDDDPCARSKPEEVPTIEILVHIPEGTPNIDEKWKTTEGELRIVRSRWRWLDMKRPLRDTFDPEAGEFAVDTKAAGLDAVFASRL